MPDGFLFPFELERVNLDDYAALRSINDKKKQMIVGIFILINVLTVQILSKPGSLGLIPTHELVNVD